MNLDLSDEETSALTRFLRKAIDDDRYPLSPRIRPCGAFFDKLRSAASPRAFATAEGI